MIQINKALFNLLVYRIQWFLTVTFFIISFTAKAAHIDDEARAQFNALQAEGSLKRAALNLKQFYVVIF